MSIYSPTLGSGYATASEVRSVAGLSSTTDISDSDLNELIVHATVRLIADITVRLQGVKLDHQDDNKTVFHLPVGLLADRNADSVVDAKDIDVTFYKEADDGTISTSATGAVTIQDAKFGVIQTANALPDDYTAIADYNHYRRVLDMGRAKRAVIWLTAHLAIVRAKSPGKVTRADLSGVGSFEEDRDDALFLSRSKFLNLYKREVAGLTGSPIL